VGVPGGNRGRIMSKQALIQLKYPRRRNFVGWWRQVKHHGVILGMRGALRESGFWS
jgi:hypothetical protein